MEINVCRRCRKLFESITGSNICPNCSKELEGIFKVVKQYIRSHTDASIYEVAEACETDIELIKYWIKEERIEYTTESVTGIECERCGKAIRSGRLCVSCKTETIKNLSSAYVKKPMTDKNGNNIRDTRMRYLDKDNIRKR